MRELAKALLNGSGRSVDTLELCSLILAEPEHEGGQTDGEPAVRPLTDAEMFAVGLLAIAEETGADKAGPWFTSTGNLRAELERRGVL
jgi:hypothetical protein